MDNSPTRRFAAGRSPTRPFADKRFADTAFNCNRMYRPDACCWVITLWATGMTSTPLLLNIVRMATPKVDSDAVTTKPRQIQKLTDIPFGTFRMLTADVFLRYRTMRLCLLFGCNLLFERRRMPTSAKAVLEPNCSGRVEGQLGLYFLSDHLG